MIGNKQDLRQTYGVRPIVNLTGTITAMGGRTVFPWAIDAAVSIMERAVDINELQGAASRVIARVTGAEAGCVTACSAAGISMAIAACMSGDDLGRVEQLPDTTGLRNEVVVQLGHLVNYSHPVETDIRLTGARVVPLGEANRAKPHQLEARITERTACALFVVADSAVGFNSIPFEEFVAICHARDVPVVVDLAAEYDLRGHLAQGADLTIYSASKWLGAPTAGIVAGRRALVRAVYYQNWGIGRAMKVGKEGIGGTMAALEAWEQGSFEPHREQFRHILAGWQAAFSKFPGVRAEIHQDPGGNPFDVLRLTLEASVCGLSAWHLERLLGAGSPPLVFSTMHHQRPFHQLDFDPRCLCPGEEAVVIERIVTELTGAREQALSPPLDFAEWKRSRPFELADWPYA